MVRGHHTHHSNPKEANIVLSLYAELTLRDVVMVVMETCLGLLLALGMNVLCFFSFNSTCIHLFNCISELI